MADFSKISTRCTAIALIAVTISVLAEAARADDLASQDAATTAARFRQPVALALVADDSLLVTVNRRSGSVSVIDVAESKLLAEYAVGERLSDLVAVPGDRLLLATDEVRHQLLLLVRDGHQITVAARIAVPGYPVSVRVTADGKQCFVASLWSRCLTVVDLEIAPNSEQSPASRIVRTIQLPFAPRMQVWIPDAQRVVVADSFSEKLAVIDPLRDWPESVRSLPAHNIRGLQLSADGKSLLVAHQVLSRLARTDKPDVHWGLVLSNQLKTLSLDSVLNRDRDILKGSQSMLLGDVGRAGGDPGAIALGPEGRIIVALSGVGEVAIAQPMKATQSRISAGQRPTTLVATRDGLKIFAADTFGDAVHRLDPVAGESVAVISLGAQPELAPTDRGERLFHDARLSHDGWMSCQSCHTDGHSNQLLNDNLGDGSFGAPKRVLSLLGVGETGPWAWHGSVAELGTQVRKSVRSTMQGRELADDKVEDLVAYLRSLPPAPALGPLRGPSDKTAMERGQGVFERNNCQRCHAPPTFTTPSIYDVGLKDEVGQNKFNPPSLRGVSQRDALFHDNRASSLVEVFTKFRHQLANELSGQDLADLIEYLCSL